MIRIVIIGSGNVAQHLIKAFDKKNTVEVIQVFARNNNAIRSIFDTTKITHSYTTILEAELYIIAVSDNAIMEVASKIPFQNKLIVHTSGSVCMDDLGDTKRRGVFYPLQTFSKSKEVNFKEVPICIEAQNEADYQLLETVAKSISDTFFRINSKQRKALHVSAVFVSNFVNYLYQIGHTICNENNIPFEILQPLIQETAQKIKTLSPIEAQTGPAIRRDTQTVNAHLAFLTDENQKDIYKLLTKSIIDHGKKL
jgi:predicted short-subunit dehydrogenase-like oxidoreductase (DUF2520 family)